MRARAFARQPQKCDYLAENNRAKSRLVGDQRIIAVRICPPQSDNRADAVLHYKRAKPQSSRVFTGFTDDNPRHSCESRNPRLLTTTLFQFFNNFLRVNALQVIDIDIRENNFAVAGNHIGRR